MAKTWGAFELPGPPSIMKWDKSKKNFEKTPKGYLMRMYNNMRRHNKGSLPDRQAFYDWALNDATFNHLFQNWKLNGCDRRLAPSINRLNKARGYEMDNIQFTTWANHNSRKRDQSVDKEKRRREIYRLLGLNYGS